MPLELPATTFSTLSEVESNSSAVASLLVSAMTVGDVRLHVDLGGREFVVLELERDAGVVGESGRCDKDRTEGQKSKLHGEVFQVCRPYPYASRD